MTFLRRWQRGGEAAESWLSVFLLAAPVLLSILVLWVALWDFIY
jgi:hypothetical protein